MGDQNMGRGSRSLELETVGSESSGLFLDEKYQGCQRESCASSLKRSLRATFGRCFPGETAEEEEERTLLHLGNDAWDCSSPPLTRGWGVPTTLSVTPRAADFTAVARMSPCSRDKLDERLMEQRQRIFE